MEMHIMTCQKLNNLFLIAVCQRRHYFFMLPVLFLGIFQKIPLQDCKNSIFKYIFF